MNFLYLSMFWSSGKEKELPYSVKVPVRTTLLMLQSTIFHGNQNQSGKISSILIQIHERDNFRSGQVRGGTRSWTDKSGAWQK